MYFGTERKNIRLRGYDYSSDGYYFITICVKYGECVFGNVINGIMGLSDIGCIVAKFWQEIPNHFDNVQLDEWIVMPNHVHGIVIIRNNLEKPLDNTHGRGAINRAPTAGGVTGNNNPMGKRTLGEIIRWFKGRCSFEIHKNIDHHFTWQRAYYDHIIRNNKSLNKIRGYIQNNPAKWERDRNKPNSLWK